MSQPALAAQWQQPDATQYAALSFLAWYRGDTLRAYTPDLRAFLRWCVEHAVEPLQAQRPHLKLYLRWMEQQGLAPASIGRRFTTVTEVSPLRGDRRALREGSVAGGDTSTGAVGVPEADGAAPIGVRGAADRRSSRRPRIARAGRAAGDDWAVERVSWDTPVLDRPNATRCWTPGPTVAPADYVGRLTDRVE